MVSRLPLSPFEPVRLIHAHATRTNVGDDAIVIATYRLAEELFAPRHVRFIDVTRDPLVRPGEPVDDVLPLYEYHRPRYWLSVLRALWRADGVLIGGGELIGGNIEFLGLALLAQLLGRPVVFYGIGVDVRNASRLVRAYARFVLPRCERFMTRDVTATAELHRLGVPPERVIDAADIVLALDADPRPVGNPDRENGRGIGVSLRSLVEQGQDVEEQLPSIAAFLDRAIEETGGRALFIPFLGETSPYERAGNLATDLTVWARCRRLMRHGDRTEVYQGDNHPFVLMDVLARLDLVVAMRLHASLLALCVGTPVIALGYSPKVQRVLDRCGSGGSVIPFEDLHDRLPGLNVADLIGAKGGLFPLEEQERMRALARENIGANVALLGRQRSSLAVLRIPLVLGGLIAHGLVAVYASVRLPDWIHQAVAWFWREPRASGPGPIVARSQQYSRSS